MSAYMVDDDTIRYIIAAAEVYDRAPQSGGFRWFHNGTSYQLKEIGAERMGQILLDENAKSVGYRYNTPADGELPGGSIEQDYTYHHNPARYDWRPEAAQLFKTIQCYSYQACETGPEFYQSEAHEIIDRIRYETWSRLPGYEEAEWGAPNIEEDAAALRAQWSLPR